MARSKKSKKNKGAKKSSKSIQKQSNKQTTNVVVHIGNSRKRSSNPMKAIPKKEEPQPPIKIMSQYIPNPNPNPQHNSSAEIQNLRFSLDALKNEMQKMDLNRSQNRPNDRVLEYILNTKRHNSAKSESEWNDSEDITPDPSVSWKADPEETFLEDDEEEEEEASAARSSTGKEPEKPLTPFVKSIPPPKRYLEAWESFKEHIKTLNPQAKFGGGMYQKFIKQLGEWEADGKEFTEFSFTYG